MIPNPTEDEVAAALAAVSCYVAGEQSTADGTNGDWRWKGSATLIIQGLPTTRSPQLPTWGNVERLRRAGRGGTGLIGQ
jgi:hypothetical protein